MLKQVFLSERIGEVLHDHVGLGVELLVLALLMVKSDRLATNFNIIHFVEASLGFFLCVECEETILKRFLSLVITFDHCFLDLVPTRTECFVQLEVIEVSGQVASV